MNAPTPVSLAGEVVLLEPLALHHIDDLMRVAIDEDLWKWTGSIIRNRSDLTEYVKSAIELKEGGRAMPYATCIKESGVAVGSTRFANISLTDSRVEIGWTWLGRGYQRTGINTEAKFLMLKYAFETLGCVRVELKTHVANIRSREAMKRIGAVEEGILRSHTLFRDGKNRDTIYYSILDREWATVSNHLIELLTKYDPSN